MHKYMEVAKVYFKTQLIWRADVAMSMVFIITKILFAYLLWGIIFKERSMVADFTFQGMLSYYMIHTFLSQIDMSYKISEELARSIRNGTFSKYMIIPIRIEGYFTAMVVGMVAFYMLFNMGTAVIWSLLFKIQFTWTHDPLVILCAILMVGLGLLFMIQLNYYLGILTLKYEEISTFLMIKNNIIAFISGSIIPLALLPELVLKVMRIFPFYYVTYLPAMLLTGRREEEALSGVVVLAIWCIVMQVLIHFTWNRYCRKYDGVGI